MSTPAPSSPMSDSELVRQAASCCDGDDTSSSCESIAQHSDHCIAAISRDSKRLKAISTGHRARASRGSFPAQMVSIVKRQASVVREEAIRALRETDGDVAAAIFNLTYRQTESETQTAGDTTQSSPSMSVSNTPSIISSSENEINITSMSSRTRFASFPLWPHTRIHPTLLGSPTVRNSSQYDLDSTADNSSRSMERTQTSEIGVQTDPDIDVECLQTMQTRFDSALHEMQASMIRMELNGQNILQQMKQTQQDVDKSIGELRCELLNKLDDCETRKTSNPVWQDWMSYAVMVAGPLLFAISNSDEQWDLVIETMASTIHPEQQLRIFQKLKKIAEKMITKDDPKYRTLYLNNPKLQHTVLTFDGGLEFLYNLGFEPHPKAPDRLVCNEVNSRVVQACLICLEDKIEVLSYDVSQSQTHHGKGSISEEPHNLSDNNLDKPSMNQQQASYGSGYDSSYYEHSYQPQNGGHPAQQYNGGGGGGGGGGGYANQNGYQQSQQQYQQQQYSQYNGNHPNHSNNNNNGFNDKNQVIGNLQQLGFAGLLNQNNAQSNRSSPEMHQHGNQNQLQPQQLQQSKSDYGYQSNNNQMDKASNLRSHSRPIPPPPMKPSHSAIEYGAAYNRGGGGNNDESKIQNNVRQNLEQGNNHKLEHMLGGVPKYKKMYKTFIFIRHGNSIWNRFKNSGRKKKWAAVAVGITEYLRTKNNPQNHADTWVVDAPLSRVGIDEAYSLSRFLGRHLTLRQFESLADLEHHQALATPIKDALRIIQTDILDPYSKQLQRVSPDLYSKCKEIRDIMEDAHKKIQRIMLETEAKRNAAQSGKNKKGGHVTKGADIIENDNNSKSNSPVSNQDPVLLQNGYDNNGYLLDDDEKKEKENQLNVAPGLHKIVSHVVIPNQVENVEEQDDLEMPLELEWVLDQMVDSSNSSIVVTSNLRRAISTAVIALWDRFGANRECIHILPCLQELGMNVDTHTPILDAQLPEVSNFEKTSKKLNVNKLTDFYQNRLKVESTNQSFGKKSLRENAQDTQQRLNFFCDWAFKKNDDKGKPYQTIIACGHSHWMRAFFKNYLPEKSQSMAGKRKLQNCGVVGFRMICHIQPDNKREYEIIDRSITPIYRGFI